MECKNCNTSLLETSKYCPNCSAKVINNRLTLKHVIEEFFTAFICWDNKFLKTVVNLFKQPKHVVDSYLSGVRKRYMQPFAFMVVALTIYGVYMYFSKDEVLEYLDLISKDLETTSENAKYSEFSKKSTEFAINYFNIGTFGSIPFLALLNLMIFKTKNFIEHCIILFYVYANYILGYAIIGFIGLLFNISFTYIYPLTIILMLVYHMYAYQKIFELSFFKIIIKTILFWVLITIIFIIFSMILAFALYFLK